jgi:hypothetical protein
MKCQLRKKYLTKRQVKNVIRLNSALTKFHLLIWQLTKWYVEKLTKWLVDKMPFNKLTVDDWHVYNMSLNKRAVYKIAYWQNGILTKWHIDKMAYWQNGILTKWHIDKMAHWQNGKLTTKYADKMSCNKMVVDKMAHWQNPSCLNGQLTKWHSTTEQFVRFSGKKLLEFKRRGRNMMLFIVLYF